MNGSNQVLEEGTTAIERIELVTLISDYSRCRATRGGKLNTYRCLMPEQNKGVPKSGGGRYLQTGIILWPVKEQLADYRVA